MPVKDQALPRICIRCLHVMGVLLSWKCDVSEGLHVSTLTLAGHFPTSSLCFHRFPGLLLASWQQFLVAEACLQGTAQLRALNKLHDQFYLQYKHANGRTYHSWAKRIKTFTVMEVNSTA